MAGMASAKAAVIDSMAAMVAARAVMIYSRE
jgi:hypothetical protein